MILFQTGLFQNGLLHTLFQVSGMAGNDYGFLCVSVFHFNMGAVLANHAKTIFFRYLSISEDVIGILYYSFS